MLMHFLSLVLFIFDEEENSLNKIHAIHIDLQSNHEQFSVSKYFREVNGFRWIVIDFRWNFAQSDDVRLLKLPLKNH